MLGFGLDLGRRPSQGSATPVGAPTGFAMNGASNTAMKAMIARVKAGTGRGRIVLKGDSLTGGQGGGTGSPYFLTNARPNRYPTALAELLSAASIPTLDSGVCADNGVNQAGGFTLSAFDPRVAYGSPAWAMSASADRQEFAGGGYIGSNTGRMTFAPVPSVDTFKVVFFNSAAYIVTFDIDGAGPASLTASGGATIAGSTAVVTGSGGFSTITVTASSASTHTLGMTANNTAGILRSVIAYNSAVEAIDMIDHASCGATATDQGKLESDYGGSTFAWRNNDALDFTIVMLGGNDVSQGIAASTFQTNLQRIVTTAKVYGDVLVMFMYPASGSLNGSSSLFLQTHQAAKDEASASNVSFLSLYDYYAGVVDGSRTVDGVHGTAAFYAEIAGVMKLAIQAMNGGTL